MALKNSIKVLKAVSGFIVLSFCFSCEEVDISLINCLECTIEEPFEAVLEIKLERLNKYASSDPSIYITIYEGNLESDVVFSTVSTSNNAATVSVPINKKYTVTASYYIDEKEYIAVNAVTPHVKYDKENCKEPCYYITDNTVNLRLKYTK